MGDVGALGVIIDDLITVLKSMDFDDYERDSVDFCINVLLYIDYLAKEQGIDLDLSYDSSDLLD